MLDGFLDLAVAKDDVTSEPGSITPLAFAIEGVSPFFRAILFRFFVKGSAKELPDGLHSHAVCDRIECLLGIAGRIPRIDARIKEAIRL